MRRETFKFWDLVWLILETLRYFFTGGCGRHLTRTLDIIQLHWKVEGHQRVQEIEGMSNWFWYYGMKVVSTLCCVACAKTVVVKWRHIMSYIWVNIGSVIGLVTDGTRRLPERMSNNHLGAISGKRLKISMHGMSLKTDSLWLQPHLLVTNEMSHL